MRRSLLQSISGDEFLGNSLPAWQKVINTFVSNISLADYLSQPAVAYQGGADGLEQILTQKYIAFWQNSNWEAFFNQRRTGIPEFSSGPGTGNGAKIPVRWQYPVTETSANATNYRQAIQRQYQGADDLDGLMWILQE